MGVIINFAENAAARRRELPKIKSGNAEILFFTGVRYQKYVEVAPMLVLAEPRDDAPTGNSRKRKRRA